MSKKIIVSVGTSLLVNNLVEAENCLGISASNLLAGIDNVETKDIHSMKFAFENSELCSIGNCPPVIGLEDFAKAFFAKYLKEDEIHKNIKARGYGGDKLPAEISSLYLYYYDKEGKPIDESPGQDRVILLTTDTPDALLCAKMLKGMICRIPLFSRKCVVTGIHAIDNLDVYNPKKWANDPTEEPDSKRGINKLLEWFNTFNSESSSDETDKTEVILIRTGGYKEFSADLKLFAIHFGFESLYLFERSYNFVVTDIKGWPQYGLDTIIKGIKWRA